MAGEPVGRIGTVLHTDRRAMRSRYTGHGIPLVRGDSELSKPCPLRDDFPRMPFGSAFGLCNPASGHTWAESQTGVLK